MDLAFERV